MTNILFVVKQSTKDVLFVRCINNKCGLEIANSKIKGFKYRQAKYWVVREIIKSKFMGVRRLYKPHDIIEDVR